MIIGDVRVEVFNLVELGGEDDVLNYLTLLLFQPFECPIMESFANKMLSN